MPRSAPHRPSFRSRQLALGVKDQLRQVRLQLRTGARTWVERIGREAAGADARGTGRVALDEPLHQAALRVLHWVDLADRAAADWLGSASAGQRHLRFLLAPMAQVARTPVGGDDERARVQAWYAAWQHLLALQPAGDVMVRERGLQELLDRLRAEPWASGPGAQPEAPAHGPSPGGLALTWALQADPPLLQWAGDPPVAPELARRALLRAAAAFVLACEAGGAFAHDLPPPGTAARLALADELVAGSLDRWERALCSAEPAAALSHELAFQARHL